MTDVLLDPNDSGEVARLPGETRMRIDLGEATQNLSPYLVPSGPFPIPLRHNDAVPESLVTGHGYDPEASPGPIVDMVDTVTFGITGDLTGPDQPKPPRPLPNPGPPPKPTYAAETERISLLGAVAGIDGELRPSDYVGRHRHAEDQAEGGEYWEFQRPAHERCLSPWWALAGVVVAGLAIWAGLYLGGAAIISAVFR